MDASSLAFLIAAAGAAGLAFLIYQRRELVVPGRPLLAALRAAVLVLVIGLIWNPQLPGDIAPQAASDTWVLVDQSESMAVAGADGWAGVLARVRELAPPDARIATFGNDVRVIHKDSLDRITPDGPATRLATAVERAAESGARRIVVVSDLRIQDPAATAAVLGRTRAEVVIEGVPSDLRNVAVAEAIAPGAVEAGQDIGVDVVVQGEGVAEGDTVTIEVRGDGRLVATGRTVLPADGRQVRVPLTVPAPSDDGQVRITVRAILDGDVFPTDDERVLRVDVGPDIRGVALVSLRPTWEPRFLLPVLQQVTGLEARGYLRLADGRYLLAGGGASDRRSMTEDAVRQAVAGAELLVLHGVGAGAPSWLAEHARASGRLLVFAHDPQGAALAGVEVGNPLPGEWYPVPEIPASPFAADLAGATFTGLPPLSGLLPLTGAALPPPLYLARDGAGRQEAALALATANGRRRAAVLASGFWRWGFRDGVPKETYRRFWAAASGWLLATEALAGGPGVRPTAPVLSRGEAVTWRAPGLGGDSMRLSVTRDGVTVVDTVFVVPPDEVFRTGALASGTYEYRAETGDGSEEGAGAFDVESYVDELLLPPSAPNPLPAEDGTVAQQAAPVGRPLRTQAVPYLLLLLLLCGEWIGRRRLGLR
jgi:hypothetical protein